MQTLSVWFVLCRHEWKAQIHIRKACSFSPYHRSGHVFSSSKLTKSWNLPFSILLVPPGRMNTGSLNSRGPWLQTAAPGKSVKCLVPFFHLFVSWKFRFFDHFVAFFVPICFWKWTWRGHTVPIGVHRQFFFRIWSQLFPPGLPLALESLPCTLTSLSSVSEGPISPIIQNRRKFFAECTAACKTAAWIVEK